jgi:hypothetical protein
VTVTVVGSAEVVVLVTVPVVVDTVPDTVEV